ncbi:SDR family oxidoreductase [Mycobacterium branderi]|uniref:Oxidoreductase n=1 Tax=Mycobacterium branderi TaxID=43348 RepID=A0A7I7W5N2_9MYCO|nr:SDR family oxidoreductase [Mycobacterium branderi]MCV7236112.1 SDR family oxidoreductase [Mycobacterium branderi]ORA32711.1 oxidoreductase [Mycobacterium branderi]BBZ12172.1 oxidoreductase [Mycobacterium branderi]
MRGVSVITGGAGGMGLATAKIVGREHSVVVSDVDADRLDAAAAELKDLGVAATAVLCDITDRESVAELVETSSALGTVASVIHTAGVSPSMGGAEMIMRINAVGTVNVNESFFKILGEGSAIVNVASMAAHMLPESFVPTKRFGSALRDEHTFMKKMMAVCSLVPERARPGMAYSISKSFVRWYCTSQASRFGSRGARILSVSPGSIDTAMGRLEEQSGAGAMIRYAALKRFGKPEEIAELLAFCASDKAGYLTGTDILCDGGTVAAMTLRDKLTVGRKP